MRTLSLSIGNVICLQASKALWRGTSLNVLSLLADRPRRAQGMPKVVGISPLAQPGIGRASGKLLNLGSAQAGSRWSAARPSPGPSLSRPIGTRGRHEDLTTMSVVTWDYKSPCRSGRTFHCTATTYRRSSKPHHHSDLRAQSALSSEALASGSTSVGRHPEIGRGGIHASQRPSGAAHVARNATSCS